jgi:mono/diheme cytochrome c family protein
MSRRVSRLLWIAVIVLAALALIEAPALPQNEIRRLAVRRAPTMMGPALYDTYCAACHGTTGQGDGPAALALENPIPDLARIGIRDGSFDRLHVKQHLSGVATRPSREMPNWDRLFRIVYGAPTDQLVLERLALHLETLQINP